VLVDTIAFFSWKERKAISIPVTVRTTPREKKVEIGKLVVVLGNAVPGFHLTTNVTNRSTTSRTKIIGMSNLFRLGFSDTLSYDRRLFLFLKM